MTQNKYDISESCAKRVAKTLAERAVWNKGNMYGEILDAMRAENIVNARFKIDRLISIWSRLGTFESMAALASRACAYEAYRLHGVLDKIVRGQDALRDYMRRDYAEWEDADD